MSLSQNVFIRLVSLHARGAVMSLIFLKSVRLSNAAREKMAIGQVVNLMANDRCVWWHHHPPPPPEDGPQAALTAVRVFVRAATD